MDEEIVLMLITEKALRRGMLPVAITQVVRTDFFNSHKNDWDGWFVWVKYTNGQYEIWFVVDLRAGYSDDDWFLEKIT